ncbi:hypothetical protein INR49_014433, partial [Caranx melampygus]
CITTPDRVPKMVAFSVLMWAESTCPEYSGSPGSSSRDRDYPAAQESSPAKRVMGYRRITGAFCMCT